jgi:hypothetical protein
LARTWFATWLLLLTACESSFAPEDPADASRVVPLSPGAGAFLTSPPIDVDDPIDPASGELADRWIYYTQPGQPCPPAQQPYQTPGTGPLFGQGAPGELARFCVYEAPSGLGGACPIVGGCAPDNPSPDLMVMAPSGISLQAVIGSELRTRFLQQMSKPPTVLASTTGHQPVRLALFDTSTDWGPSGAIRNPGRSLHGFNLANIIHEQPVDPMGRPLAEAFTNLAMQLYTDPNTGMVMSDQVNGGEFGTIAFLASAVYQEVGLWQPSRADRALVLNMSLGWDPEWGGDPVDRLAWPPAIEALYRSLEWAKCQGALTFVASGNKLGGPTDDSGPLYPAGWGTESFHASVCADDYAMAGITVSYLEDTPLVHAVGGVNGANQPLALSRNNSQPRLVAFGDHGAALDTTGALTDAITGTSVAAAVVSTAASALWANRPDLNSTQVADALYASGSVVGPVDTYWCGSTGCDDIHRIDVCSAVHYACDATSPGYAATSPGGVGAVCDRSPNAVACTPLAPVYAVTPLPLRQATLNAQAVDVPVRVFPRAHTAGACGPQTLIGESPIRPADPCPGRQYYDAKAEPWLNPQPRTSECPSCWLKVSSGQVNIEWSTGVSSLDSVSITLTNSSGVVKTITSPATYAATTNPVQFYLPATTTAGTEKASVTGRIGTTSYSIELVVIP